MKKLVLMITALLTCMVMRAASEVEIDVKINYNGDKASVSIPEEVSQFVSCTSDESSHVKIIQTLTGDNNPGGWEIRYSLSGTTTDGEFYIEGNHKCIIELNNLTLTNPSGAALNIQNGKRIKIEVKKGTENSLEDGKNSATNGCIHCEGHLEFKKTGTLNIVGNNKHAVYSKEYLQIAKPTINITKAKKDGFHCKQYFWMEDACNVTLSGIGDDGIQVELVEDEDYTGTLPDHEDTELDIDENSGYFYQDNGTLTINDCGGAPIKADGKVVFNGGTQNFDTTTISENNNPATGISTLRKDVTSSEAVYDLNGQQLKTQKKGVIIQNGKKIIRK